MLPLYFLISKKRGTSKSEESDVSSNRILITESEDIFGEPKVVKIVDSEPKVIEILDYVPEIMVISDMDSVFASIDNGINKTSEDNSSSNRLLIYSNYACVSLSSFIRISYIEIVLVSKITVLDKIKILYYVDI